MAPSHCFQQVFSKQALIKNPLVHYLLGSKQQTDTVGGQLVNIVEHLAAKEPEISPQELVEAKTRAKRREGNRTWIHLAKRTPVGRLYCSGSGGGQLFANEASQGCAFISFPWSPSAP